MGAVFAGLVFFFKQQQKMAALNIPYYDNTVYFLEFKPQQLSITNRKEKKKKRRKTTVQDVNMVISEFHVCFTVMQVMR